MIPSLACVSKRELPLPQDVLALLGQYLRKPTPSAQAMRKPLFTEGPDTDIQRWHIFQILRRRRQAGYGRFVTNKSMFSGTYNEDLEELHLRHCKLNYTLRFCACTCRQVL